MLLVFLKIVGKNLLEAYFAGIIVGTLDRCTWIVFFIRNQNPNPTNSLSWSVTNLDNCRDIHLFWSHRFGGNHLGVERRARKMIKIMGASKRHQSSTFDRRPHSLHPAKYADQTMDLQGKVDCLHERFRVPIIRTNILGNRLKPDLGKDSEGSKLVIQIRG